MLSCGHLVSLQAWRTYEAKNRGRTCGCVQCNEPVESISKPFPRGQIGYIVRRIREECQALNDSLDSNQQITSLHQPLPNAASEVETSPVDSKLEQFISHPTQSTTISDTKAIPSTSDRGQPFDFGHTEARPNREGATAPYPTDIPTATFRPLLEDLSNASVWENEARARAKSRHTESIAHISQCVARYSADTVVGELDSGAPSPEGDSSSSVGSSSIPLEHKESLASLTSKTNLSDTSSVQSGKGKTQPVVQASQVKTVSSMQIGQKKLYEGTAISPTCQTIALITRTEFYTFSLPEVDTDGSITMKCCGYNDGRFGQSSKTMARCFEELSNPRNITSDYLRAAMSDTLLCIACAQGCVDIHEISTGRRVRTLDLPSQRCSAMAMSSNEKLLAVGMENGEFLLFKIETGNNCVTTTSLIETTATGKQVNCIAFSPNSVFMSFCTSDNNISTYNLGDSVPILVSTYNRLLDMKSCRDPYYGVTSLA